MKRVACLLTALLGACATPDYVADAGWDGGPLTCSRDRADAAAAVSLHCPARVDLGCIAASGRRALYAAPVASCQADSIVVQCNPPSGSTFMPGDTLVHCAAGADAGAESSCEFIVSAGASGATRPQCTETVEAACTGAATMLRLPGPRSDTTCGSSAGTFSNDAPAAGFPLGTTDVHFRIGSGAACITRVSIVDREAPALDCTVPMQAVTRTTRGAPIATPLLLARDACSGAATVTAEPAMITGHGAVPVTYTAVDASRNSATCIGTVTVRNGFAAAGLRVAHAAITGARPSLHTTVTLVWDHTADSDATQYRIERATAAGGPWTAIGTVTASQPRHVEMELPGERAFYRVVTLIDAIEGGTTEPVRALAVTDTSYSLGVQPVPGLVLPANVAAGTSESMSAPIHAIVRHPTDLAGGPYPLILQLHGNHGNCRLLSYDRTGADPSRDDACVITNDGACRSGVPAPNAEGMAYLAETLASHGYVVASVDANAINCREVQVGTRFDGFISHRAQLLIEHLRRWRTWSTSGAAPFGSGFAGRVDLSRVGLLGHSRGAEAVAALPGIFATAADVAGISLASVFALAPTNFDNPQAGSVPFASLVPACDGDVFTYDGVQLYDRTLRNLGDEQLAVQIFLTATNHNFFNSEWRFDDNRFGVSSCTPGTVGEPRVQRGVLEVTVPAWFDGTLAAGATLEPWFRASGDVSPGLAVHAGADATVELRRSYSAPRLAPVDNFEDADPMHNLLQGALDSRGAFANSTPLACTGVSTPPCDRVYQITFPQGTWRFGWPHRNVLGPAPARAAMALDWTGGDAVFSTDLAMGSGASFDASGYRVLSLRVASRVNELNPDERVTQDFEIRIVDAAGHRAAALASEVIAVPHLYPTEMPRAVLQTVPLVLAGLAARSTPPVDLAHLAKLEVAMSAAGFDTGSLLIDDIEFAR